MNKKPISPVYQVPTIYFAMGLPFVALSMISVLIFPDMEVSDAQIAFRTSLIMFPWTLKPLWSSFLEMFKTKKYFVVATKVITGLTFVLMTLSLPLPDFFRYAIALMGIITLSGATYDIMGDGVYLVELTVTQQAKYIGWQGAFYNLTKIFANGGLIWLVGMLKDEFGMAHAWMIMMLMCVGIMILIGLYHIRILPSGGGASSEVNTVRDALNVLREVTRSFFPKKHIIFYIVLIILYRFTEEYTLEIVPSFLKAPVADGGLGLSTQDIGPVCDTFEAEAFVLGSFLAGYYISAYGLRKTLFSLRCALNIPFLVHLPLTPYQPSNLLVVGTAIVFKCLGYGFGLVGLMLFMMQQVAPDKHQMVHYVFATGIMNLRVMLPRMMSRYLSDWLGYRDFFVWVLIATTSAFVVAWLVPFTYPDRKKK